MKFRLLINLFALIVLGEPLLSCTSILVTKGASQKASPMISYSCDGEFHPRLKITPATDNLPGTMAEVGNWRGVKGKIPQVYHTYKVIGHMNERQLAIGESTFGGRKELINDSALFHYWPLMNFALQRAKTAREAIDIMTSLVEKYGYCSSGESFSIADKEEVWIMEMVGTGPGGEGAVWAAVRIPDGMIAAHANMSRIRELSRYPKENVLHSKNMISFAIEKGFYDPDKDGEFSFSEVYCPPTEEQVRYSARRVWSIFRRSALSMNLSPDFSSSIKGAEPYPLYIKPDKKLNAKDVIELHRDHYEGTEFDMTKNISSGPFGAPDRWRPMKWQVEGKTYVWERPIATQQAGFVFVSESRAHIPDEIGGIYWYGPDNPYTNFFTPFYTSINELPDSYTRGALNRFSRESVWWAFNFVANYANLRWNYMIEDIRKVQAEIEDTHFELIDAVDETAMNILKKKPELVSKYLTNYCVSNAEMGVKKWWELADYLVVKYNDGYIQDEFERPREIGYPEPWLKNEIRDNPEKFRLRQQRNGKREL